MDPISIDTRILIHDLRNSSMDFGSILDNRRVSKVLLFILYGVLSVMIGYNGIYYLFYFSANRIALFVPRQHLFLFLLSTGELAFLIYANRRIKFQLLKVKMIMKKNLEDSEEVFEDNQLIIDSSVNNIRKKIILKNSITVIGTVILASIIFYTAGILQNLTLLGLVILLIYHYNTQKVDPQEIKDSMKYDRQLVDLDGGIAAQANVRHFQR